MFLQPASPNGPALPRKWIDELFKRMKARYGQLWMDRYGRIGMTQDELADVWAEELAGFTGPEIARGLAACRAAQFPPTLPEFIAYCRPPIDAQAAHSETVKNLALRARGEDCAWSHPALFWAALDVGQFDLMNSSYAAIRARWEAALRERMSQPNVEPVPPAMKALPAPKAEINEQAMSALHDLVAKMRSKA